MKIVEVGDSRTMLDVNRQKAFLIANLFSLVKFIKEYFRISLSSVKLRNPLKLKFQQHIKNARFSMQYHSSVFEEQSKWLLIYQVTKVDKTKGRFIMHIYMQNDDTLNFRFL